MHKLLTNDRTKIKIMQKRHKQEVVVSSGSSCACSLGCGSDLTRLLSLCTVSVGGRSQWREVHQQRSDFTLVALPVCLSHSLCSYLLVQRKSATCSRKCRTRTTSSTISRRQHRLPLLLSFC